MRRESHQYRGIRRPTRGAGWGHRAVYVGAAIATAALVTGFGLAGFYFGAFSHVWNQSSASGNENAAYGVLFLSEGATYADLISDIHFNATSGPCSALPANGTNELNQSAVAPGVPLNLSASNATNSINSTTTIVCLNAISGGAITYLWDTTNGTLANGSTPGLVANYTSWDELNVSALNVTGNTSFNESLGMLGVAGQNDTWINETGCNPVFAVNNSTIIANAAHCAFWAGNNQTTFMPHGGFFAPNGAWINETTTASPDPWYWEGNESGYAPSDQVYYASIGFNGGIADMTYEVVVSIGGATPIPQVFFVNTGTGANETVTFVFDMTAAWTTALPGPAYGTNETNATEGYFSDVTALVGTVSITVSQCYVDGSGLMACPNTLGGTALP